MGSRAQVGAALLVAGLGAGAFLSSRSTTIAAAAQRDTSPLTATASDQVDLSVTVYNSNIALVRDVRQVSLPSGTGVLHLADIAASVNPATVHFRSLTEPTRLAVLEQNYRASKFGRPHRGQTARRARHGAVRESRDVSVEARPR